MKGDLQTISGLRRSLADELSLLYPGNEALSISRLILEHNGIAEYTLLSNPSEKVNAKTLDEIKKIVGELKKNRPIQYILGETEFYGMTFFVDEHVLIPRQETEEMVSMILQENRVKQPAILDIGCGSGCIAISLARHLVNSRVSALDSESEAIRVASRNAKVHDVQIRFMQHDIFNDPPVPVKDRFDIIVSNPPYVTHEEKAWMLPHVRDHEPARALFVPGEDPLIFFRRIAELSAERLADAGVIWVEINEKFGKETGAVFENAGFSRVNILKDIHGKERFIRAGRSMKP